METQQITSLIESALEEEQQSSMLLNKLELQLPSLSASIALPDESPALALRDFIIQYIEHVPSFISAVSFAAKEAGIEAYVIPFLEVARDYLLSPKGAEQGSASLSDLLEQAYLAQRLIEEVNDQYILRAGIPLIPMDVTKANIIVHHLLGEVLANSLDEVVEETARQMTRQDQVYGSERFKEYVETRKGPGWDMVWKQWSDMTSSLAIDLELGRTQKD